ncbi:MAG: helix-turn-helix domain-containing protein, partial [Hyphomicrobiales bacterium]|nr:helix-turn-helix domain-containing protein [Hyphomicrobiales bacterium]
MKLSQWLKNSETSARALAARVGTTEATISRLKNGRAQPSLELAGRIAQATGGAVTANDFLTPENRSQQDFTDTTGFHKAAILLVIGGGIAAYKSLDLIRRLRERGATVRVILTRAGAEFVTPLSVGAISGESPFTG